MDKFIIVNKSSISEFEFSLKSNNLKMIQINLSISVYTTNR